MNYKDLRNKTVFDFCEDNAILAKVTGFSNPLEDKEYIKGCTPLVHAQMLQKLAMEIKDQELLNAAEKLEKVLWKEWDAECNEAQKKGLIID